MFVFLSTTIYLISDGVLFNHHKNKFDGHILENGGGKILFVNTK